MLNVNYPLLWTESVYTMASAEDVENVQINIPTGTQDELIEATLTALETGVLTPLVKEELKYTIQSRRLASGQGELGVEFKEPRKVELREDEIEKINRRREQNKFAARRFRQKRKAQGPIFARRVKELEAEQAKKIEELRRLRQERLELKTMLENHLKVCPFNNTMEIG